MPDLGLVKSNVARMVNMGAPESDIDSYIQSEGTNIDAVKNFQVNKGFFDAIGASLTPEQKASNPTLAGIQQTAQDVATIGYKGLDALTLGNMSSALRAHGINPPNFEGTAPENKSGLKLAGDIAGLKGFISNPLVQAGGNAAMAGKVVQSGAAGAATGALMAPANEGSNGIDIGSRGLQTGVGALTGGAGAALTKIPNAISGVKNFATGLINGPEKATAVANEAKFNLSQQTAQQIADAQRVGKIKVGIAAKNADAASQGYDDLSDTLKKQVAKASDKEGLDLQSNLPRIFGENSKRYGAEQQSIIDNLPDTQKQVPVDKVVTDMEKTLVKFKILKNDGNGQLLTTDAELTPTEQKILGIYRDLKKSAEPSVSVSPILGENGKPIQETIMPSGTISVEDLMKNQKFIEPDFGKAFQPDDKLKAEIARGFANHVENSAPALQALKTKYAPFLEWKNAAIDKLKPFNGKYDVAIGTVSKTGSTQINPSEQRLMAKLQEFYQSPSNLKVTALNKGIQQTAMNKEQSAQAAKETIQKLRNSIAKDINEIRQSKALGSNNIDAVANKLIQKYKNQRILVGLGAGGLSLASGGKLLEYFVRKEASAGLK